MQFLLSDLENTVTEEARRFARQRVLPHARKMEAAETVAPALWAEAGELGFFALLVDEANGGVQLGALGFALVVEALAGASPGFAYRYVSHVAGLCAIEKMGRLDAAHLRGEQTCAYSLGGDVPASDELVVAEVEAGQVLQETLHLKSESRPVRPLAHSAASLHTVLKLQPPVAKCAPSGAALVYRLGLAALAQGSVAAACEAGVLYAKERKQFGRPIASFQAIQWKIADNGVSSDIGWFTMAKAAVAVEKALVSLAPEALLAADVEVAIARVQTTKAAKAVADHALQIHGGYGYTREYPVELHLRSAQMCGRGLKAERQRIAAHVLSG